MTQIGFEKPSMMRLIAALITVAVGFWTRNALWGIGAGAGALYAGLGITALL